MSTSTRRSEAPSARKLQPVLADLDHVARLQQVLLDRLAVDRGAVGGAEVLEVDLTAEWKITACSPLTARLSMTTSLCERRPTSCAPWRD
jgi:hypothetical protein